jgi:formylglycine-generating enzyme required for sulfatase activity
MKPDQALYMGNRPLGDRIGFACVCAIVALVAGLLSTRGTRALQPAKQLLPDLQQSTDLQRFRADAWYLPNEPLLGFVEIPGGSFLMGSDPNKDRFAFENERWSPDSYQGKVELPSFFIGRYEVTVAQFRAFAEATGYKIDLESLRAAPTHPVANVSWADALSYAQWLESALRQRPELSSQLNELLRAGWHITLPTEAQWEKAARGSDGRIYPWGNLPSRDSANFGSRTTAVVGSLKCSECPYQLVDMSGNVWEMTRSPYRPYPFDAKATGDLQADALFVMRGGSFGDSENIVRAAIRGGIDPGARRPTIGFRVVLAKTG